MYQLTFNKIFRIIFNFFFSKPNYHRYDDVEYKIKDTIFKNGAVVASKVDRV